jgi:2-polyprenyl-3-methyl-5-hydroxy-6-metoxy-1,4-benzoquinol methylase
MTPEDYRSRLYQRYVTQQVNVDIDSLKRSVRAGFPFYRRLISRYVPVDRTARILDLGCGYGPLLHELRRAGYTNITGVDASPEQVKMAKALGLDCVNQGDLSANLAEAPVGSLDVISAIDVLEHFSKDEIIELLDKIYSALKPGGVFILHVPNGEAIFAGKIFFGDFTHQTAFTRKSIRQAAFACGFTSVDCFEDKPIPHGIISSIRSILWWIVRTKFRLINAIETGESGKELILSQNLLAVCRK